MKIRGLFLAIMLVMGLQGCSSLNPLSFLSDKPSVEVNANVGKNVKQEKSVISASSGKTEQTADTISNGKQEATTIKNITENVPFDVMLLIVLLAGLAIDGKGFLVTVRSDVKGLIKFPFNFILLLFGREKL